MVNIIFFYHHHWFCCVCFFSVTLELFYGKIKESILWNLEFYINGIFCESWNTYQMVVWKIVVFLSLARYVHWREKIQKIYMIHHKISFQTNCVFQRLVRCVYLFINYTHFSWPFVFLCASNCQIPLFFLRVVRSVDRITHYKLISSWIRV